MTRRKNQINQTRALLYSGARMLGDINALSKGANGSRKESGEKGYRKAAEPEFVEVFQVI
jgi:hypothetical protein